MIRLNNIHITIESGKEELENKICKTLKIGKEDLLSYEIVRCSIDARKKPEIYYSYIIDVNVKNEKKVMQKHKNNIHINLYPKKVYQYPNPGEEQLTHRPIVVGFGPAGIFAALALCENGFKPIIIERGERVDEREAKVHTFWESGILDKESNVSFGEGGAGTFSDGKLNTLVKDDRGRNTKVLQTFVDFGADKEILYSSKPHIGTDMLKEIIKNIREHIISLGGEFYFSHKLEHIKQREGKLQSIEVMDIVTGELRKFLTDILVLAIGHSARDTFDSLYDDKLFMKPKSFAMGVRIQHSQEMIDKALYGEKHTLLPVSSYKLTYQSSLSRGVYSFCMCPGGYVVDSSTEDNHLVVNGMSYHKRDSGIANSAIIVTVREEDFIENLAKYTDCDTLTEKDKTFAGIYMQRDLEKKAYTIGEGKIPVQLYGDFEAGKESVSYGEIVPCFRGRTKFARVDSILPDYMKESIIEAMPKFDKQVKGFYHKDAVIAGIESRTSSPIRIERDESMQANIKGVYPCGEGAGYAGGITSAAMDGLKVAESIIAKYERQGI